MLGSARLESLGLDANRISLDEGSVAAARRAWRVVYVPRALIFLNRVASFFHMDDHKGGAHSSGHEEEHAQNRNKL